MPNNWGLLPGDVRALILKREWHNEASLKARLLNRKPFPIRIGLKPPKGSSAIADMSHFQNFISTWRSYLPQKHIQWEKRRYRLLDEQTIPKLFILKNINDLIDFIGPIAQRRSEKWLQNMSPLLSINEALYPVLVSHLKIIDSLRLSDAQLLAELVSQLSSNMGQGLYLRSLPLQGVDTKFLENYQSLVADIMDVLFAGELTVAGGLFKWLGCEENPKGWLGVRPLCASVKTELAGFPVMQLDSHVLRKYPLPADHILVVENMQSGLGLPQMKNTIAVFGGGKNINWIDASWLKSRHVGYWGDIDSWGLSILSDARTKLPSIEAIMMDAETVIQHKSRMVDEPEPLQNPPDCLSESELQLFKDLTTGKYPGSRLEQERLSPDYIRTKLQAWQLSDQ